LVSDPPTSLEPGWACGGQTRFRFFVGSPEPSLERLVPNRNQVGPARTSATLLSPEPFLGPLRCNRRRSARTRAARWDSFRPGLPGCRLASRSGGFAGSGPINGFTKPVREAPIGVGHQRKYMELAIRRANHIFGKLRRSSLSARHVSRSGEVGRNSIGVKSPSHRKIREIADPDRFFGTTVHRARGGHFRPGSLPVRAPPKGRSAEAGRLPVPNRFMEVRRVRFVVLCGPSDLRGNRSGRG